MGGGVGTEEPGMNETSGPKGAAPGGEAEPPEYQPPAIAWEEPLEAIAAITCTTFEGGCEEIPSA